MSDTQESIEYNLTVLTLVNEWTIKLDEDELKDFYAKLKYAKSKGTFFESPSVLINPEHIVSTKHVRIQK